MYFLPHNAGDDFNVGDIGIPEVENGMVRKKATTVPNET
jgi:hypothetical protein